MKRLGHTKIPQKCKNKGPDVNWKIEIKNK